MRIERRTRIAVVFTAMLMLVLICISTSGAAKVTAKQVIDKASKNYDAVTDYVVDAAVSMDSPSIHMPDMKVKLYYKKPDKVKIDSKDGFAMLPRQGVMVGNPLKELSKASRLSLAGSAKALDTDCYVLKATVIKEDRDVSTTIWVDKKDWLVRQIEANPESGATVKIKMWYTRVQRKYWLPSSTVAQVSIPPFPRSDREGSDDKPDRPTIVSTKFSKYRVNTGLKDELFAK